MKKLVGVAVAALVMAAGIPAIAVGPASGTVPVTRNTQGYLGVELRDVSDEQVSVLKLKEQRGAEIVHMDHDGPAGKAGLREHDVIVQMNGQTIEGEEQLRRMLRETPAGRTVSFLVSRDGQTQMISAQLANRAEIEKQAWDLHAAAPEGKTEDFSVRGNNFMGNDSSGTIARGHSFLGTTILVGSGYTGAVLDSMEPQLAEYFGTRADRGLLVRSVDANSPAAAAGMKAGDVVVKVNSREVASRADWLKTVRENKGRAVTVVVLRDRKEQTLTMTPDAKKRSAVEPELFFFDKDGVEIASKMVAGLQPEIAGALEQAKAEMDAARKQLESPAFKKQMDDVKREMDAMGKEFDLE